MWYLSNVFKCFPFLSVAIMSMVSSFFCMYVRYSVYDSKTWIRFYCSWYDVCALISGAKCSSHLSHVFHWTVHAFHLVDSTTIFVTLWFTSYYILYCVFSTKCYFHACISKKICDSSYYSPLYVNVTHFFWFCSSVCVLCFWLFCRV
jgi:hypothetical protein